MHAVFGGLSGQEQEAGVDAQAEMRDYFKSMYDRRRTDPEDLEVDILTYLLSATVDGEPIPEDDLLNMAVVLVLAGLDTTKSQLGYNFHYLATHPEDRARLVADPSLMPTAIEELLRFHAFVPPARKLKQDVEYEGCPMKAGQMVLMPLWSATRDPRAFEDAGAVRIDRSPTATSPSVPARTAAPVPTWRAASCSWRWRSGTSGSPTTSSSRPTRSSSTGGSADPTTFHWSGDDGSPRRGECDEDQGRRRAVLGARSLLHGQPELFQSDDEGFVVQRGTEFEVAAEDEEAALLAVASCPEGAISVVDPQ